jgi:hypothetical protein
MAPGVAQLGELLRHSCGRSCTLYVRSDDKKTSFASGDMFSQLAKDIYIAAQIVPTAKARLIVELHSCLCGWPAVFLASFLLASIVGAGMAAAALSGTDRAIRISHCRHVQT